MLKAAILAGCAVGVAASLADITVSQKYRTQIRTIIALILIVVISGPFMQTDFDSFISRYIEDMDIIKEENISQQAMAQNVLQTAEENLSEYISAKLVSAGIKPQSVSIELTVTQDGQVQVSRTNVVIDKEDLEFYDDIKRIVSDELLQGEVNVSWEDKSAEETKA